MSLRLLPLGGLGEIGRNCLLVEHGEDALIIDCGVQFPGPDIHGVDLILPDFEALRARRGKLRGIVVTHGHEDHLGAVPYLLRELPLPVYASKLTLALLERKLEELRLTAELHELAPRQLAQLGSFTLEPIRVAHSIPDCLAIAIRCAEGLMLHTGDFKLDQAPIDGEVTDLARFAELGEEGVLCLLSDSTNATREGSCPGELTIAPALREVMREAPGRVVVALFASNLHRIQQVLDLCASLGRKVVLNGRSLIQNVELAEPLHRLRIPAGVLVSHDQARDLPAPELCILSTGAQGEPRSGLTRLAHEQHGTLFLEPRDRVVFSASLIPGNELGVHSLVNQLARRHIESFQEPDHKVHVSGHAYRNDQRLLLKLVRPKVFIPIHGEARHLAKHRELALEAGVPLEACLEVYDGDWVELREGRGRVAGHEPLKNVFLDRFGGTQVPDEVVRDRRTLADAGLVTAILQLDRQSGDLLREVQLQTRGFTAADRARYQPAALKAVTDELANMPAALRLDLPAVEEAVVRILRRVAKRELERRPVVLPVILRL